MIAPRAGWEKHDGGRLFALLMRDSALAKRLWPVESRTNVIVPGKPSPVAGHAIVVVTAFLPAFLVPIDPKVRA